MRKVARCIYLALSSFTLVLVLSAGFAGTAAAAPSDLDASFDGDGKLTTAIGTGTDRANAVAIQPDGKIVAAGYSDTGGSGTNDFALARYNVDGSLDTGFDVDGKVTTPIGISGDEVRAIAIQPDGKIVAAGDSFNVSNTDFALARFNADGSLDTGFGVAGKLTTAIGADYDYAYAIAIQPDGKIVVAGSSYDGSNNDFALARYDANGLLDTGFGVAGKLTTAISANHDDANAVAIQSDGKIVAAGPSSNGSNDDFALARYNADGSLDAGFSGDGKLTTAIGSGDDYASDIAIQADGKIVAAGTSYNGTDDDFALARYNADGSLDTGFSGDGILTTAIGSGYDSAYAIAIQADGKIVAAGTSYNGTDDDFALARYNADGSLDTDFDGDGKLTTAIGSNDDAANAIAIQPNGKIVVAGYSDNSGDDFALARYMGDPPPPAAAATPPAAVAPAIPTAKITRPAHRKFRSKALKAFAGTAGPAGQVAKVELALRRVDRRQLKRGRCLWLRNSKAKFVKTKAKRKRCATQRFLLAKGTDKWSFKLRKRLTKGSYELFVRITLKTGESHTTFTKAQGNLMVFKVI